MHSRLRRTPHSEIGGSFLLSSRTRNMFVGIIAASALALTGCTSDKEAPTTAEAATLDATTMSAIDEAVAQAMQWSRSTEAVIGVWTSSGEYVHGFSTDDASDVDANALFRGAQTTQPVMCALLLDLVAEGMLSLDRELTQDIPRQTGVDDITYGQLCDGTSPLPDFKAPYNDIFVTNPTRHWATGEFIAESLIRPPLSWPGLDVHRSDTNAVLLGKALTVVTGESLEDLLKQRVFKPAGMSSSYYPDMRELTITDPNSLSGLAFLPGPVCEEGPLSLAEVSPSILRAAGATVTSVTDVKQFYEHYLGGTFGGDKFGSVVTEALPTKNPERDEEGNPLAEVEDSPSMRGFGVVQIGSLWGFDGSMPGSATSAWHDPAAGFTVVVALNNSTVGAGFATTLAHQITALVGAVEVPWSAEDKAAALAEAAICQEPEDTEE